MFSFISQSEIKRNAIVSALASRIIIYCGVKYIFYLKATVNVPAFFNFLDVTALWSFCKIS